MTIDERLEKLRGRTEALFQALELMQHMQQENEARWQNASTMIANAVQHNTENIDRLAAAVQQNTDNIGRMAVAAQQNTDNIGRMAVAVQQNTDNIGRMAVAVQQDAENIRGLARIAEIHEHRLSRLEGEPS